MNICGQKIEIGEKIFGIGVTILKVLKPVNYNI
jgi:hypothetical protein